MVGNLIKIHFLKYFLSLNKLIIQKFHNHHQCLQSPDASSLWLAKLPPMENFHNFLKVKVNLIDSIFIHVENVQEIIHIWYLIISKYFQCELSKLEKALVIALIYKQKKIEADSLFQTVKSILHIHGSQIDYCIAKKMLVRR